MLSNQRIFFFLFIGLAFVLKIDAQKLQGRVTNARGYSLEGVTVINNTARMGTVSNVRGRYSISYTVGDTIQFSSVGYDDFVLIMEDLPDELSEINITMEVATTDLDEVVVRSDQISEAEIKKIIDKNFGMFIPEKQLTQTERRAYTASSSPGGLVSFDYILNLINGRIKRIKMLTNWERQDAAIEHLQAMLPEEFFLEKLGLKEDEVYPFLLYCMESAQHALPDDPELSLDIVEFFLVNLEKYKEGRD